MNERIKELAEQASLELFNDTAQHRLLKGFTEKFAELLVRECANIANRQFIAATGLDDRDCLTANEMKQYFGVKE